MTISSIKKVIIIVAALYITMGSARAQHSRAIGLYIDSFTKFFLWPNEPKNELVIGIYGETGVYTYLQRVYEGKKGKKRKKVRGMNINLKKLTSINEINRCDIIFISKEKSSVIDQINSQISGLPILVVTCILGYKASTAVNIDIENNYNLEICSENIRSIGMKISSTLTHIADEI